jgi:hypothetical protein
MRLALKKFFNTTVLITPKKAWTLYEEVVEILKTGGEIILDFEGVKATTLIFHYVLFSNLYNKYGKTLKNKLQIKNASEEMIGLLQYLHRNYKELNIKFSGQLRLG